MRNIGENNAIHEQRSTGGQYYRNYGAITCKIHVKYSCSSKFSSHCEPEFTLMFHMVGGTARHNVASILKIMVL